MVATRRPCCLGKRLFYLNRARSTRARSRIVPGLAKFLTRWRGQGGGFRQECRRAAWQPGRPRIAENASAVDWAFYFVDFFRYAAPAREGPSPSLTVCNACYRKADLAAVAGLWSTDFHETAIHDALRARFGPLWLEPRSEVTMARHVKLRDALYERYAFGRLFGCKRIRFISRGRRLYYAILAPALPALLLLRMARKALRSRRLARAFLRSLLPLTAMVLTWSWGEWLGYVTGRHPRSLVVAPEIRTSRRDAATGQDFDPGPNR